ncbi:hypothetical protein [Thermomonospora umbrina]|uniref:hypothetical protein n=1 Tax=Thermomonospora umbrina TaxID=111806 RepID=UPI0011C1C7F7|nr:hypothetical protein [Thermomonospora umbrina]
MRERDAAEEQTPADLFAAEFFTALRGQGWRPTAAVRVDAQWKTAVSRDGVEAGDAYRLAREHLARIGRGVRCEVCCPCEQCAPPYERTACTCDTACGTASCGARNAAGGAA